MSPNYVTLIKLLENNKATFLSQSLFSARSEEDKLLYKGAAIAITAILASINDEISTLSHTENNEQSFMSQLNQIGL